MTGRADIGHTRQRMVVTGREGQVVTALAERAAAGTRFAVISIGRPTLDLSRPQTIDAALRDARPDVIVSAAAYTAVDQAENDEETYLALRKKICEMGGNALSQPAWVKDPSEDKPRLTANAWTLP